MNSDLQNMYDIFVTEETFHALIIPWKMDLQNMNDIFVTDETFHALISPWNWDP